MERENLGNWKITESFMYYTSPGFNFHSRIIITNLDDCLINYQNINNTYNTDIEIFCDEYIKKLYSILHNTNTVIISNYFTTNRRNIGHIKLKVEKFYTATKLPICCVFSIKPDIFMKPHTGSWKFIDHVYKSKNASIINCLVVSNEGGLEIKDDRTGSVVYNSDVDRAFANNIGCEYKSIDEYLEYATDLRYKWDDSIILPNERKLYIEMFNKNKTKGIFGEIIKMPPIGYYVIMIMGYPRSGKTTLANHILKEWSNSPINENHAVEVLSSTLGKKNRFNQFKKLVDDRISVILDGGCHTDMLREPYINYMKKNIKNVICINIHEHIKKLAMVFNHVYVETNFLKANSVLYKTYKYDIYYGERSAPKNIKFITYIPEIKTNKYIEKFRF